MAWVEADIGSEVGENWAASYWAVLMILLSILRAMESYLGFKQGSDVVTVLY